MLGGDVPPRWTMDTDVQRAEVQAKVGYVLPGEEGRSWGSQWSLSTHRHQHHFGVRNYDGVQNTFRGKVLRSGFMGSPDWAFSAGVSYLYDDFDESGTWTAPAVPVVRRRALGRRPRDGLVELAPAPEAAPTLPDRPGARAALGRCLFASGWVGAVFLALAPCEEAPRAQGGSPRGLQPRLGRGRADALQARCARGDARAALVRACE